MDITANVPETTAKVTETANTLDQLLNALTAADEGMIDVNLDEQIDLLERGKVKVDNYKYLLDKMESQAELYKKWWKEFSDMEKAVRNNRKKLLDHMSYALQKNGFDKFTGNRYVVALRKARPAVDIKAEANSMMKLHFPEFVRTEYSWDKIKIAEALKNGDERLAEIAGIKETIYPKFSVVKGV